MEAMEDTPPDRTTLAGRVKALRELRGYEDQTELAIAAGISQSAVSDIERGVTTDTKVRASTVIGLSHALTVTWEYLLHGAAPEDEHAEEEAELVALYRAVGPQGKVAILENARALRKALAGTTIVVNVSRTDQKVAEKSLVRRQTRTKGSRKNA